MHPKNGRAKAARLYVGNIPYSMTTDELVEAFQANGFAVSNPHIVIDRETGSSQGFGFVELASAEDADAAISVLDGKQVAGRTIRVDRARERERGR